jgi:lysophospholipase L1-like esterase
VAGRETTTGATLATGTISFDTYSMPDGATVKTLRPVTIRSGGWDNAASVLAGTPKGTFLRAVYVDQRANVLFRPNVAAQKLYVLGDSIAAGVGATIPMFQGWIARMRRRYPGAVVVDAYSGRTFKTDADTAAKRLALAQWIAQANPTDVYLALGINDYVAAAWTAAAFGTAYASFLDNLHTAAPNARIFCQSPIAHTAGTGEGANGLGDTMAAFATQISNGATDAARVHFCYFVDGKGAQFPTSGDLADGTHPNNLGHGKQGQGVCLALASAGAMG